MTTSRVRRSISVLAAATVVVGLIVSPTASAAAAVTCAAPVPSTTQPGYTVADPNCDFGTTTPFVPLTNASGQPISQTFAGIRDGAAYRIEVPLNWNGDLVLYAHGFRGSGTTVWVDSSPLRVYQVTNGFAWAASSYQTNGYDVGQGVRDSHALIDLFRDVFGHRARHVYMTGASMGGHITAATIEHFPHSFVGAMPICGVLGDAKLFDYFLDANVTAAALTGAPITFPLQPTADFPASYVQLVNGELPALGSGFGRGPTNPPTFTPLGQEWAAAVEQRTGGTRPGFDSAFAFWNSLPSLAPLNSLPFLFGIYPGLTGGTIGIANGNVTSNRFTIYQLDGNFRLSPDEIALNRAVLRVSRTALPSRDLSGVPLVAGNPRIPVLSMHDIGDLFVPFSMEQIYALRVALHGESRLLVTRAIRGVNHCDFTLSELQHSFADLVTWVRTGHRPAGDNILDPREVAKPTFGCRFTESARPAFVAPAC
jgi:pimeloyl-ACP methyl ester carboxylesterase